MNIKVSITESEIKKIIAQELLRKLGPAFLEAHITRLAIDGRDYEVFVSLEEPHQKLP